MRNIVAVLLLLTLATPSFAQEQPKETVKTFTFKKTTHADKTTPVSLDIHVHFPPDWKAEDKRPAIIFWFGGGFTQGTVKTFEPQAKYFASRGMVAARADYRVKSRHGVEPDACIEDGKSAMRWLRQNAAMLGADPDRIVASGGSAGGYIAACTAFPRLDAEGEDLKISTKPNALVLFNPFFPWPEKEANWKIVPTRLLTKDTPPTLMMFGTKDDLLKNAEKFMEKSKEVGHRAEMYLAEGAGHGFYNGSPWRERTMFRADEFLESLGYLKGKPTIKAP